MQVCFGNCRLDSDTRRLFRDEQEVHLSPKAFELLKLLIGQRPKALSKSELLEHVWQQTFVSDVSLARAVAEIRKAIGDDARDPRFLRTVYAFGYAFTGTATEVQAAAGTPDTEPACWVIWGSREVCLHAGENRIGRDPEAKIRLDSPRVSRFHARIVVSGGDAVLEDLGSKNGTYLCGQRITAPARLEHGNEIEMGSFRLRFRVSRPSGLTETEVV